MSLDLNLNKEKISRFSFILNGALFMPSGYSLLTSGETIFGCLYFVASTLNLLMLKEHQSMITSDRIKTLVLTLNIVILLGVAWQQFNEGKNYVQYVWLLAAFFSSIALALHLKRNHEK